jgi:hypothetical protein
MIEFIDYVILEKHILKIEGKTKIVKRVGANLSLLHYYDALLKDPPPDFMCGL